MDQTMITWSRALRLCYEATLQKDMLLGQCTCI